MSVNETLVRLKMLKPAPQPVFNMTFLVPR